MDYSNEPAPETNPMHPWVKEILGPTTYVPSSVLIRGVQLMSVAVFACGLAAGFYQFSNWGSGGDPWIIFFISMNLIVAIYSFLVVCMPQGQFLDMIMTLPFQWGLVILTCLQTVMLSFTIVIGLLVYRTADHLVTYDLSHTIIWGSMFLLIPLDMLSLFTFAGIRLRIDENNKKVDPSREQYYYSKQAMDNLTRKMIDSN